VLSLLLATLALTICPGQEPPKVRPIELTVYAAASLRDALQAIAADYEKANSVKLVFNFGSSGDLARQILAAKKADVFFSADEREMDRVAFDELIDGSSRKIVLSNQLVVVESIDPDHPDASIFGKSFELEALAGPQVKRLSLADTATVPAGRYAKAWLEKKGVWDRVKDRVLPGVDVRAALAAVESGGAEAGIVYRTDAAISKKVRVVHAVPFAEAPAIRYVLAVMKDRPNARAAQGFAQHLAGADGLAVFLRFGFVKPEPQLESKPKSGGK
jgi:molybdate transport system substrate-binding protein